MSKSRHYNKVKNYFDKGLWSIYRVHNAVVKEWITPDEFFEITGEEYQEE